MHIYLKETPTVTCPKCSKAVLSHTVCANCGFYKGKEIVDVLTKLTKRERKAKEKEMASQKEQVKPQGKLSPEELSRPSS